MTLFKWKFIGVIALFLYIPIKLLLSTNIVQFTPDDGFYYLTLARHFANSGKWTFDGIHATSGFHLLWAYLLAVISFIIRPSVDTFPILGLAMSFLIIVGMIIYADRTQSAITMLWLLFLITTPIFIYNSISLTEFCLVVLCSYCVINDKHPLIFSMLGGLARTEFIVIPLTVFTIQLILSKKYNYKILLIGIIGIGIVVLHTFIITGEFIQSSALIKHERVQYYSSNVLLNNSLYLSTNFFYAYSFQAKKIVFVIIIILAFILIIRNRYNNKAFQELNISLSLILVFTGLYWNSADVQGWYVGVFFVPVFIIGKYTVQEVNIVPAYLILVCAILYNLSFKYQPYYPHQEYTSRAARYLSENKLDGKVASWNAGIIGYYEGGNVINLDGLVNNSIYPYIKSNNVPEYLKKENIRYIVDFSNMYRDPYPRRGGYNNNDFLHTLKPIYTFDSGQYYWNYLCIAKIN